MGYPKSCTRLNCFCSQYAKIAFRNYYSVKNSYLQYAKSEANYEIYNELSLIEQQSVISVVFAHMALESFFNDYAAACLGDDAFYDNFDKLDYIGKFQLICNFILKSKLDKSKEPYASMKALKKLRNNYIHNKSVQYDWNKYQDEEEWVDIPFDVQYKSGLNYVKELYKEAMVGMKAIVEIVNYFDSLDSNVHAHFRFFGFVSTYGDFKMAEIKKELKALGHKK